MTTSTTTSVISRRGMMKTAASAAAFTIVAPQFVRGTQANSKIELGVVGCGGRGAWIANLFARHPGYQITAVADYFQAVADRCGDALKVPQGRRFPGLLGYKRLIESKVDAVALETPPWFFPEHATAAVSAGLHVYMAKPVACDVPGTLAIAAAGRQATQTQRCFLVDFQIRTDPYASETVKRIREGALGKLSMISSFYTDEGFADPPRQKTIAPRLQQLIWVNDNDIGGGYLVNAGIHAIDAALWVANANPLSAMGSGRKGRKEINGDSDDIFSITYEFPGGLVCNHRGEHIQNLHGFTAGCEAYGQGAYAEINYEGKTWLRGGEMGYRGGDVVGLYEAGAVSNIALFHKSVAESRFDNPTLTPSVNATLATLLGREAAHRNAKVTWDELIRENKKLDIDLTGLAQ